MEIANVVASTSIQTVLNRDILWCLNTGFGVKFCLLKKIVIDHVAPGLIFSTSLRMTVDPDETLVLGGIYESKEENIRIGIPGLSSIPLIGRAFQSSQRRAFKSELLIFITPRVL